MEIVTPAQIRQILGVTDALGIHREAVVVPLGTEGDGCARLKSPTSLELIAPADAAFEPWLARLPALIAQLDLSQLLRA
ncbi:MAG: hypothetical protein ACKVX7_19745 [Planctomycetota bacterium]